MSVQDLGSVGELVAAIATLLTLAYLAVQVRHNTRALKSSTFQQFSAEMGRNLEPISLQADLAEIMTKALSDQELTPSEVIRYESVLMATLRRLESVYVQRSLGAIDPELTRGFERSIISLLNTSTSRKWWGAAKAVFYPPFVDFVEAQLGIVRERSPIFSASRGDGA